MGIDVWPPSGGGTTSLTPFTGPVLTVPSAINQIAGTGFANPGAVGQVSTFVTNNPVYGGNSYATATLVLKSGGLGVQGALCVLEGSDDAQVTWIPMGGINAATGRYDQLLVLPDAPPSSGGKAMWYVPVAGLSVIRVRCVVLGGGGFFASWTGSAAGIISPPPVYEGVKPPVNKLDWQAMVVEAVPGNNVQVMQGLVVTRATTSPTVRTSGLVGGSYAVPSPKVLRIHGYAGGFLAGAGGGRCRVDLRSNLVGATTISSDLLATWTFGPTAGGTAVDGQWSGLASALTEPIDIPYNGSGASVGVGAMGSAGTTGKLSLTLFGYLVG